MEEKEIADCSRKIYSIVSNKKTVKQFMITYRETREEGPLLNVEAEANGDSKRTNERGPSLVDSLGSSCRVEEIFVLL
jgi:hypothetical protein